MKESNKAKERGSNGNTLADPLYQRLTQEWESYKRRHCLLTCIHQLIIRANSPARLMSWLQHPHPHPSSSPCKWMTNWSVRRRCDRAAREIVNERMDAIESGRLKGIRRLFCDEEEETCITDVTEWSDYYLSSTGSGSVVDDEGLFMSPALSCIAKDNRVVESLHEEVERDDNDEEEEKRTIAVRYRYGECNSMSGRWAPMKWAMLVFAWIGIMIVGLGVHWKWIESKEAIHLVPT